MKKITTFLLALPIYLNGQSIQEISTATGYQRQSYIRLSEGTETQVNNSAWDIAFTVYGFQDAGIFVNESSGSSMGQPSPTVKVYDALTGNFADQPDPASLEDFELLNDEQSWQYGAFNAPRDTTNVFDYGWGIYNPATNQVTGNRVYVIQLRNGQYRKCTIESLVGTTYTFRYAGLDGSNEKTVTLNKMDHSGKTLAYFSFTTENIVPVEPADGFDLLYCRYITPLYDPGSMTFLNYQVTGILSGRGVAAAKADGVNPATVAYEDYADSMATRLDVLGHDWKTFGGTGWSLDDDRVYFVRTADDRVWKIQFIDFEGSSTGTAVFEKTDLGIISSVTTSLVSGLKIAAYPNPVIDRLYIALETNEVQSIPAQLIFSDAQGRIITTQSVSLQPGFQVFEIPAADWPHGVVMATLQTSGGHIALIKIIR